MSERVIARHRAPRRASTPISTLTAGIGTVVGGRVETLTRGGAVIAVSSGLVASMGLQAQAMVVRPPDSGTTANLPAVPALPAADPLSAAQVLTLDQPVTTDGGDGSEDLSVAPQAQEPAELPLTAPASATLTFDSGALVAPASRPASSHVAAAAAQASTDQGARHASTSRSATRQSTATTTTHTSRSTSKSSTSGSSSKSSTKAPSARGAGSEVLAIAARYVGIYYRYGGTTPAGFDCSGYVQYVFAKLGISLPRVANDQMNATTRISRSQARAGDLVFFVSGGYATHVGIYAGDGMMYDSPHTGAAISKRAVYSANVVYGRVSG